MTMLAAIDIGSNAIRLVVAQASGKSGVDIVESQREPIRLGRDVFSEGKLSPESIARAKEAFARFRKTLDLHGVKRYRAVATSALRESVNRLDFIEAIQEASGIEITVIPGVEEARLVGLAVAQRVDLSKKAALLIDIGGGSIEISILLDGDIITTDSVNMGTVRLLQILEEKKHGAKIFARLVKQYAEGLRRQLKKEIGKRTISVCVGTGGNVECLGELKQAIVGESDSTRISSAQLAAISEELQGLSFDQRIAKYALRPDRADVVVPAAIVLQKIVEQCGAAEMLIPKVGLKDGVLYELAAELKEGKGPARRRKQLISFAAELGRKYSVDLPHSQAVAAYAVELFDKTKPVHNLGDQERMLLELAALLHEVGQFISMDGHHKHTQYLLRSSHFVGLSERERNVMACVARYHRKAYPKMAHPPYAELQEDDRRLVDRLAGLLRIAEAFDKEHAARVRSFEVDIKKSKLELSLCGEGDLLLEKWAIRSRAGLFEKVFNLKLQIAE